MPRFVRLGALMVATAVTSLPAWAGPEVMSAFSASTAAFTADPNSNRTSDTQSASLVTASGIAFATSPVAADGPASAFGSALAGLTQNGFSLKVDAEASAPIGTLSAAGNTSTASITIDRTVGPLQAAKLSTLTFLAHATATPQPDSPWFFEGNYYSQSFGFQLQVVVNNQPVFSTNFDSGVNPSDNPVINLPFVVNLNLKQDDHLYVFAEVQAEAGVDAYNISLLTPGVRGLAHVDPPTLEFTLFSDDPSLQLLSDTGNAPIAAALIPEPSALVLTGISAAFMTGARRMRPWRRRLTASA